MRPVFSFLGGLSLLFATASFAQKVPQVGAYRTVADYRHHRLSLAGTDIRYSAKHEQYIVSNERGSTKLKKAIVRDSVWGYVDNKFRLYRLQDLDEYRVEQADTITVYSRNATTTGTELVGYRGAVGGSTYSATRYYFSRGINGRIYPLSDKYLRESFAAGSPAFAAAVANRPRGKDLAAYDKTADAFYIAKLFRDTKGK